MNYGVGTAMITSIAFRKGDRTESNLARLFNFPHEVVWDDYWGFGSRTYYLRAGSRLTLARLSLSHLEPLLGAAAAKQALDSFLQQRDGIEIHIAYQDVLGNPQEPYHRAF